jgi:hypothetical protein
MDLYQPLYVPRPLVVPELFASLSPVAYGGNLDGAPAKAPAARLEKQLQEMKEEQKLADTKAVLGLDVAKSRSGAQGRAGGSGTYAGKVREELARRPDLGARVATAAAAQLGDFFQYVIERPVTLPRQKSALLPIVGKDVEDSRVSIYNEGTQPKFSLLGLRLKNTSGLHLMQGLVTVFEGSSYAGDARIADLQPNEERLLSYAVGLGTEVKPEAAAGSCRLTHVKAVKGVLYTTK